MIAKLDRCEHDKILKTPSEFSQVFDKNKDDRILVFRRTRECGKDHSMKHCEQTWNGRVNSGTPTGCNLPFHHPHNNGGNTNIKTLNGANTETLNGDFTIGGKSDGYGLFQSHIGFFHRFRVQTLANVVHATGCKDRTPRRTPISSQSCQCLALDRTSRHDWDVLHICAPLESSAHSMFHRPLLDVPDPFPSFCSTPLPSASTALPHDWNQETLLCYSARRIAVWPSG